MKTDQDYMANLDELKSKYGWNDVRLADEVGVATSMISQWRNARASISPSSKNKIFSFLTKMAKLEVTVENDSRKCFLDKCPATPPADRLLQYILESWDKLSPSAKGKIVSIVDEDKKGETCTDGHCLAQEA